MDSTGVYRLLATRGDGIKLEKTELRHYAYCGGAG